MKDEERKSINGFVPFVNGTEKKNECENTKQKKLLREKGYRLWKASARKITRKIRHEGILDGGVSYPLFRDGE